MADEMIARMKAREELFSRILNAAERYGLRRKAKFAKRATAYYQSSFWVVSFVFWKMVEFLKIPYSGPKLKVLSWGAWTQSNYGRALSCQVRFKKKKFSVIFYYDRKKAKIKVI